MSQNDIATYEKESGYLNMELLRFSTCGSVDDGKSTLIGRLLYDSKAIFEDQMEAIEQASTKKGEEEVNLALLTDGLRAEREQGITIDVAYRYFATPKRKFIIADTPGHIQYTRNMVTGASTANAAVVLIDARHGVIEQTIRHSYISSLLQIPHTIVCVNKMDLIDFDKDQYDKIIEDYNTLIANKLNLKDIHFLPISAKLGDNVVDKSPKTPWYDGPTLMHLLENIPTVSDVNLTNPRFPVQYVVRPMKDEYHDYRGYAGRIASGVFKKGDKVRVMSNGRTSTIKAIDFYTEEQEEAFAPQSVIMRLNDEIDISRGDMIVAESDVPKESKEIEVMMCWLNEKPMAINGKYALKHTTEDRRCIVKSVDYKMDINTLEHNTEDKHVGLNDIAKVTLKTANPLYFDSYNNNRITGSLVLIDEGTNETVGAGMII